MNIGDKFYKYAGFGSLLTYEIIGIIKRKKSVLYELKCLSCSDHLPCEVIVTKDEKERYKYVCITNEDEDNKQYYWHTTGDYYFHRIKNNAIRETFISAIKINEKCLEKAEKDVVRYKKKIEELNEEIQKYDLKE